MSPTILRFPNGQTRGFIYHLSKFRVEIRHPHNGATLGTTLQITLHTVQMVQCVGLVIC